MKKILKFICTFFLIAVNFLFLPSCFDAENGIVKPNCSYQEVFSSDKDLIFSSKNKCLKIITENFSETKVCYKFDSEMRNQLCVISIEMRIDSLIFCNTLPQKGIAIMLESDHDYNYKRVFSEMIYDSSNSNWINLKRVIKLDEQGDADFSIVCGWKDDLTKVSLSIRNVSISPVEKHSNIYKVLCSDDQKIRMVFLKEDVENSAVSIDILQKWINIYADFRLTIKWFVNDSEPYDGITDFIFTESVNHFAIAGNPIYVNKDDVQSMLKKINLDVGSPQNDIVWELVHEISHTFDGVAGSQIDGRWNFDSEFFATFKAVLSLSVNGYGMGNDLYTGDKIKYHFNGLPKISDGVYSNFGMIYKLFQVLDDYSVIKETLRIMSLDQSLDSMNNVEKFHVFLQTISNLTGVSIEDMFSDYEINVVEQHLKE